MSDVREISTVAAHELQQLGAAEIIDVREDWEREMFSSIPGALVLPLYTVKGFCGTLTPDEADAIETSVPIAADMPRLISILNSHRKKGALLLCICKSGNRSKDAVKLLTALGYSGAFSVAGGVNDWESVGFPVIRAGVHPEAA